MRTPISPPPRSDGGHSAAGRGFFVWYETRLEAEGWRSELAPVGRRPRRRRPEAKPRPAGPAVPPPTHG